MIAWFASPWSLLLLCVVPLLAWWSLIRERKSAAQLQAVLGPRARNLIRDSAADARSSRWLNSRWLFCGALGFLLLAMARPQWGSEEQSQRAERLDIVVCIDVSRSMLARDVQPSRIEAARSAVRSLALRASGDRLGLVAFAGAARLSVPLTSDAETFIELLDEVDELTIERGGTNLAAALDVALGALVGRDARPAALLLLTDGDDPTGEGRRAAQRCGAQGIAVHVAGFGSARGSKIPIETATGEAWLRDGSGEEVVTALDADGLRRLAAAAGGEFVRGAGGGELAGLYEDHIAPLARGAAAGGEGSSRAERYQWPLLIAVLLALVALAFPPGSCRLPGKSR